MDFDDFIPAPALGQFPGLFPHFYLFIFWCGLKHRTFITLQLWRSEVWNRSLWAQIQALAGICFFKALEGLWSWSLPAGRSCPPSLAHAPDSGGWSLSHIAPLWHWTPHFLFHLLRTLVITRGHPGKSSHLRFGWFFFFFSFFPQFEFPLLWNLTYSQVLEIRIWPLGPLFWLSHSSLHSFTFRPPPPLCWVNSSSLNITSLQKPFQRLWVGPTPFSSTKTEPHMGLCESAPGRSHTVGCLCQSPLLDCEPEPYSSLFFSVPLWYLAHGRV